MITHEIIIYYRREERVETKGFFRKTRKEIVEFLLNPQLYKSSESTPLWNFEVFSTKFEKDKAPKGMEEIKSAVINSIRNILVRRSETGNAIGIGSTLIPLENIDFSVQEAED